MNPYLEVWLADVQFIASHAGASIPRCISSGVRRDVSIEGTIVQVWPDGSRRLVLLYLRKDGALPVRAPTATHKSPTGGLAAKQIKKVSRLLIHAG